MKYLRLLFIAFIYIISFSTYGQFTPMVGILAQDGYSKDFSNIYVSQQSLRLTPTSGIRSSGMDVSEDGLYFVSVSDNPDYISSYSVTFAWDFSDITFDGERNVAADDVGANINGIMYGDGDTKMYITDSGNDGIQSYTLSTAGDSNSSSYVSLWNPAQTVNEFVFNINPNGDVFQIMADNDQSVYQFDTSTDWIMASSTYDASNSLLFSATDNAQYLTYVDTNGKNFAYNDPGLAGGASVIRHGSLDAAWDFTSTFTKDITKSMDFFDMSDGFYGVKWHEADKSFVTIGYGLDYLFKMRFLTDDTYETAVDEAKYHFPNIYGRQIITPKNINSITGSMTLVADIAIELGKGAVLNELAGSYSNNWLRWWHVESSGTLSIQIADGTNTVSSTEAGWTNDGLRHQIVAVYTSGTGVEWYIDGSLTETDVDTDLADWSNVDNNQQFFVGARQNGAGFLGGDYYNFQIYDKALNSTEVGDLWTDISDTATSLEMYLGDQKGKYFWKDESTEENHAGVESVLRQKVVDAVGEDEYSQNNAASRWTEVNNTTGWTTSSASIASSTTAPKDGTYSLLITSTASGFASGRYIFSGTKGKHYTIKLWTKAGTGSTQILRNWVNFTGFNNVDVSGDTAWTEHIVDVIATTTADCEIRFYSSDDTGNSGDILYVDKIMIIEN